MPPWPLLATPMRACIANFFLTRNFLSSRGRISFLKGNGLAAQDIVSIMLFYLTGLDSFKQYLKSKRLNACRFPSGRFRLGGIGG